MFNDLILDKMKKVFEYIATLLLLLAVGTSCEEGNDNWKVITAVPTGLYIALPKGFEAQIRPRSGLALKKGIGVLNSPGTIDADYRGEICIILINFSAEEFTIEDGERIAQMVIARHEQAEWQEVEVLDETERGAGGFGHTGKN